jgi:hypothetical protein
VSTTRCDPVAVEGGQRAKEGIKLGFPVDFRPAKDVRMLFPHGFVHIASIVELHMPKIDLLDDCLGKKAPAP